MAAPALQDRRSEHRESAQLPVRLMVADTPVGWGIWRWQRSSTRYFMRRLAHPEEAAEPFQTLHQPGSTSFALLLVFISRHHQPRLLPKT